MKTDFFCSLEHSKTAAAKSFGINFEMAAA